MNSIHTYKGAEQHQTKHHNIFLDNARIYLAAALMLVPSVQVKSDKSTN